MTILNHLGGKYLEMMKNEKIFDVLFKLARDVEPVAKAKLAACIVYKNDIVSFGINRKKSHPFQKKFGKNDNSIFLHAENDVIKNVLKTYEIDLLSKMTLYICRVKLNKNKNFIFGLSKPCCGCQRSISNFGIKKVYYSLDNKGYEIL